MDMREFLIEKGFSIKHYAMSRGLDYHTFVKVVMGVYDGKRRGKARDCVAQLKRDGILPRAHPMYDKLPEELEVQ